MKINPSEYKILIVDDVAPNVLLLKALLGREKYNIVSATSGKEALDLAVRENPDLILLDVMMPEMDGFEVARRMREDEKLGKIPVIFLTALDDAQSVVKGFQMGGNDFISKPFRKEELLVLNQSSIVIGRSETDYIAADRGIAEDDRCPG